MTIEIFFKKTADFFFTGKYSKIQQKKRGKFHEKR